MRILDLSSSRLKYERALEHLVEMDAEIARYAATTALQVDTQFDEHTGWLEILITDRVAENVRLSALAGDYIANCRAALDHVITELVVASGGALTSRHQFPVAMSKKEFDQQARYRLRGVTVGLDVLEAQQPWRIKLLVSPSDAPDPLSMLTRMSNDDKHRRRLVPVLGFDGDMQWFLPGGSGFVETQIPRKVPFPLHPKTVAGRFRYESPYPTSVTAIPNGAVMVMFRGEAFGELRSFAYSMQAVRAVSVYVDRVIKAFEAL